VATALRAIPWVIPWVIWGVISAVRADAVTVANLVSERQDMNHIYLSRNAARTNT
jgi:hypothetical protein